MNAEFSIMTEQMVSVFILVFIGFLSAKVRLLTEDALKVISKLISKILLPAMIVTMIPMENGYAVLRSGFSVLLVSFGILVAMFLFAGVGIGKLCGLKSTKYNIHLVCATFGNMGLMGAPIISAVYGSTGLVYLSLYLLVDQVLLWTVGSLYIHKDTHHQKGFQLKKLLNPTTAALCIGLVMLAFNYVPSGIVFTTVKSLGSATQPIAMLYLGGCVASLNLKELRKNFSILLMTLCKMIVLPLCVWVILGLFSFEPMTRTVLTLCCAMPTMLSISMLAQTAGSDWQYGSQATLFTTLVSLGTLPLVTYLTQIIP